MREITEKTPIRLPLTLWLSITVLVSASGGGYLLLRDNVQRNTTAITALQENAQNTREILIRIDENVKGLQPHRNRD
jgi:hypothetical protein